MLSSFIIYILWSSWSYQQKRYYVTTNLSNGTVVPARARQQVQDDDNVASGSKTPNRGTNSSDAINEVIPRVCADNPAHFTNLQRKGRIFKGFLHHTRAEESQIAIVLVGTTIRSFCRILGKGLCHPLRLDPCLVLFQFGHGLFGTEEYLLSSASRHGVAAA